MPSTDEAPFLWRCQSLWSMSNPFQEMICLLSIHVLRHKPAYCREERSNLHRTDTVSKGRGPPEQGQRQHGEGRGKKNKKRSILFLKATAEQHIREPGRQRQAKEDPSHVCPPTQGAEREPSINVDPGSFCPSTGTQEVME